MDPSETFQPVMRSATRVGVVGLGKVGLALALVMRHHGGHSVIGWDNDLAMVGRAQTAPFDLHPEQMMRDLLADGPIPVAPDFETFVRHSDIIFICVPTPHPPGYDGTEQTSNKIPKDFDYAAVENVVQLLLQQFVQHPDDPKTVVLVSTVSPGTTRRLFSVFPAPHIAWAYQPVFISLGRVAYDLLCPDFVLVGTDRQEVHQDLEMLWRPIINSKPTLHTRVEEAEVGKLAINAAISQQITFNNHLAELCDRLGTADVDAVVNLLRLTPRLAQQSHPGLGDGGACRPRDLVTLDRVFLDNGFQYSIMAGTIKAREHHSQGLAYQIHNLAAESGLPIMIIGQSYKDGVPYQDGSPAVLLAGDLRRLGNDVVLADQVHPDSGPALLVLGLPRELNYIPTGSLVFDPWGVYGSHNGPPAGVAIDTPGRL